MRHNFKPFVSVIVASVLLGTVAATNLQQVYAPRDCPGCTQFKKLTHEFEKSVTQAVGNPDTTPADIREMHKVWEDGVLRIFPPDPALTRALLLYQEGIFYLFEHSPSGHKPVLNEEIKEFKQLTHTLRTEVLNLAHEGFLEEPR